MPYARMKNELPLIPGYSEGAIAYAPDAADAPLNECICYINPEQSGSGDPSPSNVRPITGHTELNLVHTGANLWDEEYPDIDSTLRYVELSVPNGNYTLSTNMPLYNTFANVFLSKEIKAVTTGNDGAWNGSSRTVNTDTGKLYVYYREQGVDPRNYDVMLNVGSTVTAYEPYTASTTTTDLGTTVYGGTLDVVSGVLTVTHGFKTLTGDSSESWGGYGNDGSYLLINDMFSGNDVGGICDKFVTITSLSTDIGVKFGANNKFIYAMYRNSISGVTDNASWKTWLSTHNINIVYPLATPTTTQLTPQEVTTLLGENSFYHDCNGDTKITFIRRLDS